MKILKKIGAGILFSTLAIGFGALMGEFIFNEWKAGALWVASILGGVIAVITIVAAAGGMYLLLKYIFED